MVFPPNHGTTPHSSSRDMATKGVLNLTITLQNPSPTTSFARYDEELLRAL